MKTVSEFRAEARGLLAGHLNSAALITFVYILFVWLVGQTPTFIIGRPDEFLFYPYLSCSFVVTLALLPLGVGYAWVFLRHKKRTVLLSDAGINSMFQAYHDVWRVLLTMFIKEIFVMLWMLLLIVPGIVKSISYSMTSFVLYDYPELSYEDAIRRSSDIMRGHKMQYFLLVLSFFGWFLLGFITMGIGFIWINPYFTMASTAFYEEARAEYESSHNEDKEDESDSNTLS
ncbi:MAG: DUF975 family protein [Bacteroidales bacterium]|nr:DUF975 family protein [Bacteroidales bacterium]